MANMFLVNREDLGKRITGFIFYNYDTKEFIGMTEKKIKETLAKGDKLYGLILDDNGEIAVSVDTFKTTNYMIRYGINNLRPLVDTEVIANNFYIVVGVKYDSSSNKSNTVYEVINSRYARVEMTERKLKMLLELGVVQGGVYLDGRNIKVCEGVVVEEVSYIDKNK